MSKMGAGNHCWEVKASASTRAVTGPTRGIAGARISPLQLPDSFLLASCKTSRTSFPHKSATWQRFYKGFVRSRKLQQTSQVSGMRLPGLRKFPKSGQISSPVAVRGIFIQIHSIFPVVGGSVEAGCGRLAIGGSRGFVAVVRRGSGVRRIGVGEGYGGGRLGGVEGAGERVVVGSGG